MILFVHVDSWRQCRHSGTVPVRALPKIGARRPSKPVGRVAPVEDEDGGCESCNFTGQQYPDSIQSLVCEPLVEHTEAKTDASHGMGRERH